MTRFDVVLPEARAAAQRLLQLCENVSSGEPAPAFYEVIVQIERMGDRLVAALDELLDSENALKRLFAAQAILVAEELLASGLGNEAAALRAERVILAALASSSDDERRAAGMSYAYLTAPIAAAPHLRAMLASDEYHVSVSGAIGLGAISKSELADSSDISISDMLKTHELLLSAINKRGDIISVMAARVLARRGDCVDLALKSMVEELKFSSGDTAIQYISIQVVGLIALNDDAGAGVLTKYMRDKSNPGTVRGLAAHHLGESKLDAETITENLIAMLVDDDSDASYGAALGIATCALRSASTFEALCDLLVSDRSEIRALAARTLAVNRELSILALPVLFNRVGVEAHFEVIDGLASAIASAAPESIETTLDMIRFDNALACMTAVTTLKKCGHPGVTAIANRLAIEGDPWFKAMLIAALRDMGSVTAPAVERLGRILLEEVDPDIALWAIAAITATGTAAAFALPGLMKVCADDSGELSDRAENAIWALGPTIVPELVAFNEERPSRRIEKLLARVLPQRDDAFHKLEAYGNDGDLTTMYYFGWQLNKHRGMSSRKIEEELLSMRESGKIASDVRLSDSAFSRAVQRLERQLVGGRRLVTRTPGRRGNLTPTGLRLLQDISQYLRVKGIIPYY